MKLRTCNHILSVLVCLLGLYIMITPFLPQFAYLLRDKSPKASIPYAGSLAQDAGVNDANPAPQENRIVIPSIQLNEPIIESDSISAIKDGGTWRRPRSSEPAKDGNTVIVGHRYYGSNVSTFYHLDKVLPGQKLAIYWEGVEHVYEVTETKTVEASQVEIEAPTTEEQVTLYTCTPIWTAKQRLVVIAKPTKKEDNRP